jgi:hypothetical protein
LLALVIPLASSNQLPSCWPIDAKPVKEGDQRGAAMPDPEFMKWALTRAREIVAREGAELDLSAKDLDEPGIAANSTLLAAEIVKAMIEAQEWGR